MEYQNPGYHHYRSYSGLLGQMESKTQLSKFAENLPHHLDEYVLFWTDTKTASRQLNGCAEIWEDIVSYYINPVPSLDW